MVISRINNELVSGWIDADKIWQSRLDSDGEPIHTVLRLLEAVALRSNWLVVDGVGDFVRGSERLEASQGARVDLNVEGQNQIVHEGLRSRLILGTLPWLLRPF